MIRFRSGGWDRAPRTSGQGAADCGEYCQAAGAVALKINKGLFSPSLVHHREHSTDREDEDDFDSQRCRDRKDAHG